MSDMPKNTCVWFEIPVSDLDASKRFYEEVLSISMRRDDTGPNPMVMFSSMDDMGVSGNTIHLAVDGSLDDAMSRVKAAGGQVMSPTIDIPAGSFFYATDPDGNSIGLFTYN